jgi:parvulin-like peptidyl-prolyl isomerase
MHKAFLVVLALLLTTAPSRAVAGDRVVGRVQSQPITHLEVLAVRSERPDLSYEEALDFFVERKLVLEWARENRITVPDDQVDNVVNSIREENRLSAEQFERALLERGQDLETFRDRIRDQLTTSRAVSAAVAQRVKVEEEEVQSQYRQRYRPRDTYSLSHILFKVDGKTPSETDETVRARALDVLERINTGTPFSTAAMQWSEDTSTSSGGGALGTFTEGELMIELESAVTGLEVGGIKGPVRSSLGYHLVQLTGRQTVEPPSLDSVRDELVQAISREKRNEALDAWIEELREQYFIEIFPD